MDVSAVSTPDAPEAIGPYSQATVANGFVFCSGQIPLHPGSGELLRASIGEETERCMRNLEAVLTAAGSSLASIVKTTIFLTDMDDFPEVNAAYGRFFEEGDPPARATVAVSALPKGARVEIECVALAGA